MSDTQQTETGADQNALRNSFSVGEKRELSIAAVHQIDADTFVIAAWIKNDEDVDTDICTVKTEGWKPRKGDIGIFERTDTGMEVVKKD